jgi:Hemerythrin HHE cation binding domain
MAPLTTAFVDDHQQLTRALKQLKDALGRHDLSEAKRIAEELDCAAGPHILFEEAFLYPEVARAHGRDYIDRLYEEHRAGRDLLTRILVMRSDSRRRLGDEEQARLLQQAETTLDHAVSCGTLLSYLTTLDQTAQKEYFAALLALRQQAKRWTEIPEPAPGQDHGQVTSPMDSPELPETT